MLTKLDLSEDAIDAARPAAYQFAARLDDANLEGALNTPGGDLAGLAVFAMFFAQLCEVNDLDPIDAFAAIHEANGDGLFDLTEDEAKDAGLL